MGDHDYHQTACAYSSSSDDQLIAQLEFYFSQDNLIQDHYLRSQMDDESFVPILTICNFSKVKQYIEGVSDPEQFIATLVQNKSDVLQVDDLGEKIRAQSGPVKYRLVVREVATHFKQKDVQSMFADCEANVLSAEPTGCNSTWYIGFETESDSITAMDHLKKNYNLKVHMKKIMSGHYQGPSSRPQPSSTPGTQGSFHWSGPFTPSPGSSPVQQSCPTWFITTSTPPNQPSSIPNYDNLANYGTGNYHIIQRQQNSRGGKRNGSKNAGQIPPFSRTMYQPFQRGGYEHGTPHEVHSHHFHSTANQKFTRKPRVRGSPRPSHIVNGERKEYYRRKADGTSTPDSEKTASPVIDVPVIPAFELMTHDFPSLGDSPTPPLSNSKQEFDQLKPSKIADVLRTGTSISPEPSLSKDQKPIAPPNVQKTPNQTDNTPTEKSPQPVTTGVTATWVPHRRNLIEAIKERPKPASTNRNSVEKSTSSTKKNGSTTGATNGEIELPQTRETQPDARNVTKRVEKIQPTMTTNDNRDTNNNSEKNPKPKPYNEENVAREPKSDSNETSASNQPENDGWSVVKEKPKKIKVESRTSRTERSSFRERRPKEEREQFDKPRSNRGDRKERKPKKYDEKQKEEIVPVVEPPTPDIESESFGPSLGNPFPQSQPLLLQPNMPVSRWADIASK